MNKEDFLDELANRLSGLPQNEIDERIAFYRELIYARMEEGQSEEEVIAQLGSVDEVVSKIMSEYPLTTLVKQKVQPKKKLETWQIILLILGLPLWLPLLIAAFAVILALYIVIWSIALSLFASSFALAGSSIASLLAIIAQLSEFNFAGALFFFGAALVCAGLAILLFITGVYASKAIIILTRRIVLYIKNSFIGKEVDA